MQSDRNRERERDQGNTHAHLTLLVVFLWRTPVKLQVTRWLPGTKTFIPMSKNNASEQLPLTNNFRVENSLMNENVHFKRANDKKPKQKCQQSKYSTIGETFNRS